MKQLTTLLLLISFATHAQTDTQKISDSIVREGKKLYRSEMASWYGTDIVVEKFKDKTEMLQGYFSYDDGNLTKCIFYSKEEKVVAAISFDSTFNIKTAKTDDTQRDFTPREKEIYTIRKMVLKLARKDTLFKSYQNTNYNFIPIVDNGEKKVYILTGPKSSGVVIFGNDYLITFDSQNNIVTKKQLHKNILPFEYSNKKDEEQFGGVHTHLPETGDFITATDICTLMLYGKFANWKQHIVVGKNYVSLWSCQSNTLGIMSREAWEKIGKENN